MQTFSIPNRDGKLIYGEVLLPETTSPAPTVVMLAGQNGFTSWGFYPHVASRFCDAGFAVVNFNFALGGVRYGEDHFRDEELYQQNSPSLEVADTEDILKAIGRKELPGSERMDVKRMGLFSHSLGCGVAVISAERSGGTGFLALWSPIATLQVWPESDMERWAKDGYLESPNKRTNQLLRLGKAFYQDVAEADTRFNIIAAARRISTPSIIVHGASDESVPVSHAHDLYQALASPTKRLRIVPDAGHTFGAKHPFVGTTPQLEDAIAHTVAWLVEQPANSAFDNA